MFLKHGLVDVGARAPEIKVRLVNTNPEWNFFRKDFYHGLKKAYLRPEVADKLKIASTRLKKNRPDLSLLIMDAARPLEISKKMYDQMKAPLSNIMSPIPKPAPFTITEWPSTSPFATPRAGKSTWVLHRFTKDPFPWALCSFSQNQGKSSQKNNRQTATT